MRCQSNGVGLVVPLLPRSVCSVARWVRRSFGCGWSYRAAGTPTSTSLLCVVGECVGDVGRERRYPDVGLAELAPRDAGPQRCAGAHHDRGDMQHDLVDESMVD